MSGLLILIGFALFALGVIAIFKPLPKLKLRTKGSAVVAMALGVGSCVTGGALAPPVPLDSNDSVADSPASTEVADTPPPGLSIGSPVKVRDAEVTVTSVETRERVGGEYSYEEPSQGGVLVVVRYSIRNTGDKPLSFFSPRINLIDPNGIEYSSDAGKTASLSMEGGLDAKLWSDLNPGITTQDAEVFEVATDRYDPATWRVAVDGKRNLISIQ